MKYELKLKPFLTPNFAIAKHPDPKGDDISIPIHELSDEALEQLISQYASELKAKQKRKPSVVRSGAGTIIG